MISFIAALRDFFSTGDYGRKLEISEIKALTTEDKLDLCAMLSAIGFRHEVYVPKS